MRRAGCINGCAGRLSRNTRWCIDCAREIHQHEIEQQLHPWMRERPIPTTATQMDPERARRREALARAGFHLVVA